MSDGNLEDTAAVGLLAVTKDSAKSAGAQLEAASLAEWGSDRLSVSLLAAVVVTLTPGWWSPLNPC